MAGPPKEDWGVKMTLLLLLKKKHDFISQTQILKGEGDDFFV